MTIKATFEYNNTFSRHRISINGVHSEYASYQQPAVLVHEGIRYVAFSQYYSGIFPVETVLSTKAVPTELVGYSLSISESE